MGRLKKGERRADQPFLKQITGSVIIVVRIQSSFQLEETLKITAFMLYKLIDVLLKTHSKLPVVNSVTDLIVTQICYYLTMLLLCVYHKTQHMKTTCRFQLHQLTYL